ncbi:MAG: hypothetical protein C0624_11505 [Desulfuromonas sp.]|nr:MAG: hypothetical protein C0624_11505 [Desulfuromonas sp.]
MDMSKYKGMFLSEAGEHLASMAKLVISLEKDPSDRGVIDTMFRNAHSVKGMAASMGYENTATLAHHLEDILDGFRKTGEASSDSVDTLLDGIDLLEGLMEDIEQDQSERSVDEFLSSLPQRAEKPETATPGVVFPEDVGVEATEPVAADSSGGPDFDFDADGDEPETEATVDSTPPPSPPATPAVPKAPAAGSGVLALQIDLSPEAAAPAARAMLLFRELEQIGELLYRVPTADELATGTPVRHLHAHLRTDQSPEQLQQMLEGQPDVSRVILAEPEAKKSEKEPTSKVRGDESLRTIRVRTDLLDRFINLTGELLTNRYMLQTATKEERWKDVKDGIGQLARLITDLHHHVLQVRMLPIESITGRLPRLIRELGKKTGKDVTLRLEGDDIELDRAILDELADPLVHMVRNAVDHGIDKKGVVTVRAWREKDMVLLSVADDGWGMDPEVIRNKAIEKGLITATQARSMRDRDALQLVCVPGFSTAAQITETSGRGVGMDVVKNAVETLGGMLQIESERGMGTRILMKLPLSVAIIQILLVDVGGNMLGIPITRVGHSLEVDRKDIRASGKQMVIQFEDDLIPLVSLSKMLEISSPPRIGSIPVVITEYRGRKLGLVVDRLIGQREAFVKALAPPLDRLTGVSGATFLGEGNIVFIIDPQGMIEGKTMPLLSRAGETL